jgi:RHS repeat-associated protein
MRKLARSLRPFRGLWWLCRSAFESIQELHRLTTHLPRRQRVRRQLRTIEQLEDRTLLSTINWINPNGGDWATPANWDLNRVPTTGDTVNINFTDGSGNRPAVTVTTNDAAGNVNCYNPLVINGGALAAASTIQVNNSTGSLIVLGGSVASVAGITIASASFDYEGGSVGGTIVVNSGTVTFGTGVLNPLTVAIGQGQSNLTGNVPAGITLNLLGSATLHTTGSVANYGTIILDSVDGNSSYLAIPGTLTNTSVGVIDVGGLRYIQGGTLINQGQINVDSGSQLIMNALGSQTPTFNQQGGSVNLGPEVSGSVSSFQSGWTYVNGTWVVNGSTLSQTDTVNGDPKKAIYTGQSFGVNQEIEASVEVNTWNSGDYARAGVGVLTDPSTGQGYNLLFHGTNQVQFLDDNRAWGNSYTFNWQIGVWYQFKLMEQGGVLYGKVWASNQTEPTNWMFQQSGWSDRTSGYPALHGGSAGSGSDTVSFQNVQVAEPGASMQVQGGNFAYSGGTIGAPSYSVADPGAPQFSVLSASINDTAPATSPPLAIEVYGNSTLVQNQSPNVTLRVLDSSTLTAQTGAVNTGTIIFSSLTNNSSGLKIQADLTNASRGIIDFQAGGGGNRNIWGGKLVNQGEIDVDSGVSLFSGNLGSETPELDQEGGEFNVSGYFEMDGGLFDFSGGVVNSTEPTATSHVGEFLVNGGTIDVTSPGSTPPSSLATTASGSGFNACNLVENLSPDVTIDVIDGTLIALPGAVNDGTIVLGGINSGASLYIRTTLTNTSTGVINAQAGGTNTDNILGGDLINQGEINVASGVSLGFSTLGSETLELDQEGGEINVFGYFEMDGGLFDFSGGVVNSTEPTAPSSAREFVVNSGTINVTSPGSTPPASPAISVANSSTLVNNLSSYVTLDVIGGGLNADPGAVNDGTIVLGALSGSSTLSIQSTLTNTSSGVIEGQGGGSNNVTGTLNNAGTLLVTAASTLNVSGDLIKGSSAAISGTETGISWTGMSSFSSTVALQISTDGGVTYATALTVPAGDRQYTVPGLQPNTTYYIRTVATAPNGGQTIYNGGVIATPNEPVASGWYQFVGLEAADGSMFLPGSSGISFTEDNGPIFAGSSAGALDNALQGLVKDGSFALDKPGDPAPLYVYVNDEGIIYSFNNSPPPNAISTPYTLSGSLTPIMKGIGGLFGAGKQNKSSDPISYFNGSVDYQTTDLTSNALGSTFSQTRSWTNDSQWTYNQHNGTGVIDSSTPTLVRIMGDTTVAVVSSTASIETFELVNGQYVPDSYIPDTLVHESGQFILTDTQGNQTRFYDFSSSTPAGRQGQFISSTNAGGILAYVYSWTADGEIQEIRRQDATGTDQESWLYSYLPSTNPNAGLLASVQLRKANGSGGWNVAQQVVYTYYDGTQPYGNKGDLMTATVEDGSGNALGTDYYRYYTPGVSNGYVGGLRYVFGTTAYDQLVAAVGNPFTATNSQVAPYADQYFEYDNKQRVTVHAVSGTGSSVTGGIGTYSYSYTISNNPAGVNSWRYKTIETLPDGNQNIVYCNDLGEVMLKVFYDINDAGNPSLSGQKSETFYKFNAAGQIIEEASPAAVTGYDESSPDLLVNEAGYYQYLSNAVGLITLTDYYSATTATATAPGGVASFVEDTAIQNGQYSTPVLQQTTQYFAQSVNGSNVFPVANTTVYTNSDGSGAETTNYSYTWFPNTVQMQSATVTAPTVSAAQNGSGSAAAITAFYNIYGQMIWTKDANGNISYIQYDLQTGAVTKTVTDVNTADTGDFSNLPSGWTTPVGGGQEFISTYQVDNLGRTIEVIDPNGNVTYTVFDDPDQEVRIYAGWNSSTGMPTGPTEVTINDRTDGYVEKLTMTAAPHLTNRVPDGTEPISNIQSLTRTYYSGAEATATDDYFNLAGLTYTTGVMGVAGVNFYQTLYGYDANGNRNRILDPQGTITRTVYDAQNRVTSAWVGTNDTPATGTWSPSNPAGMTEVVSNQYDNNGVGDGNLTETIQYPGSGQPNRETDYYYNWRNEQFAQKTGVESSETDGVNRPLTVTTYDNLGRSIETQVYDGDGITPVIVGGELLLPSNAVTALRAETKTSYDAMGQVHQTQRFDVNQTDGTVSGSALTSNYYHDLNGNLIAKDAPGGLWMKYSYDGANRQVMEYDTDGAGGTSYPAASSIASDDVLSQTQTVYDGDGNVIETITSDRFNNATGTGALGTPTSGVEARVSYSASYYDSSNRPIADVDVGTNGGSAWVRPGSVPTGSNTVLVTSYSYAASALQAVQLTGTPTGGTFTLSFGGETTVPIAFDASAATVQADLEALASIGSGNVVASAYPGGGWQVLFTGSLAGTYQNALSADGSGLTGGSSPGVSVVALSAGGDDSRVSDTVDPNGIDSRSYYDALGRATETVENFTDGVVTDSSNKTTSSTYNSDSQTSLSAWSTSGFETTAFVYGVSTATGSGINSNDVVSATEQPDPTTGLPSSTNATTVTVDALGNVITRTDPNGTQHTYTYDSLGRQTADEVTALGSGVDGSVMMITTGYDALGNANLITSYSAVTGGSIVNQVEDVYNGLDQLTQEYQSVNGAVNTATTPSIQYVYTEMAGGANNSRLTEVIYPDGYTVNYNYAAGLDNSISRVSSVSDNTGTLESYQYLGQLTPVEMDHPEPGVNLTYISQNGSTGDAGDQYTGLDRFGRVVEQNWYEPSTSSSVVDLQYGYDANSNVLWKIDGVNSAFGALYSYDALNQLTSFQQGTVVHAAPGVGMLGSPSQSESWAYDALGNRTSMSTTTASGTTTVGETANAQNQITSLGSATTPVYDLNGNMTLDQSGLKYIYDAWDRLVAVQNSSGTTLETFSYDGLGNRVTNTVNGVTSDLYYSTQGQVIEEASGGNYTTRYVWSPSSVTSMVSRDTDTSGTGLTATGTAYQRLCAAQDINSNVVALVNSAGVVVERFAYDPFGKAKVFDGSYNPRPGGSAFNWVNQFQAGRLDAVTGNYIFGAREFNPTTGTWISRDPSGFAGGDQNLYRAFGNNPINRVDPSGLEWRDDLSNSVPPSATPERAPFAWNWDSVSGFFDQLTFNLTKQWRQDRGDDTVDYSSEEYMNGRFIGTLGLLGLSVLDPCVLGPIAGPALDMLLLMQMFGAANSLLDNLSNGLAPGGNVDWFQAGMDGLALLGAAGQFMQACFAAGTPIRTPGGAVAIEHIKPGDVVLSRSEFDPLGPVEAKVVEEVFVRTAPVLDLRVGGRTITTTGEHPFFAEGRGWVAAKQLGPGERVLGLSGEWLFVEEVDDAGGVTTVYNMRVADHHTYFAGAEEWGFAVWVHNANCVVTSADSVAAGRVPTGGNLEKTLQAIEREVNSGRAVTSQTEALGAISDAVRSVNPKWTAGVLAGKPIPGQTWVLNNVSSTTHILPSGETIIYNLRGEVILHFIP